MILNALANGTFCHLDTMTYWAFHVQQHNISFPVDKDAAVYIETQCEEGKYIGSPGKGNSKKYNKKKKKRANGLKG